MTIIREHPVLAETASGTCPPRAWARRFEGSSSKARPSSCTRLVCGGVNADFDGRSQMGRAPFPLSVEAQMKGGGESLM